MTDTIIVEELKTESQKELEKTIESCEWDIKYHTEERDRHNRALDIRRRALDNLKAEYESKY
ncbi:MAG: hypothetical protein Tp1102DCM384591_11 [Prokaryotic dsDNA virus sp.]|jgi:hypothetical protein|nr:MAG: hypothetical protein Tp1102DCM384591_11 [Prokaryotic dsDNA virus sp.]|tara:strand:+ start:2712 stop:2897 length:186 start_codon:yes stop_codon:yes gene_type:complete